MLVLLLVLFILKIKESLFHAGFMVFCHSLGKNQTTASSTNVIRGQEAEDRALAYLQLQGLCLLERNYRTPGRGGGEIDLIMQENDATVVFVEVRSRANAVFGGAGASISRGKCQRVVFAARHWLLRHQQPWACRFDVVLIDGAHLHWLRAAFDAE